VTSACKDCAIIAALHLCGDHPHRHRPSALGASQCAARRRASPAARARASGQVMDGARANPENPSTVQADRSPTGERSAASGQR
jgi:hypothetical protein